MAPAVRAQAMQQASRNESRFLEGSMNDRISAVPPPSFLGPNEIAAYERRFSAQPKMTAASMGSSVAPSGPISAPRPASSAGQFLGQGKKPSTSGAKFFAPLWDGMRERFHLTRSRSSGSIGAAGPNRGNDHSDKEKNSHEGKDRARHRESARAQAMGPPPKPLTTGNAAAPMSYPTREEVMENYKGLVASGFFSSHAIQGTRHPRPLSSLQAAAGMEGRSPRPPSRSAPQPPLLLPPTPAPGAATELAAASFSQHMARSPTWQSRPNPVRPEPAAYSTFSSAPNTAVRPPTRPPTASTPPLLTRPASRDTERTSSTVARPSTDHGEDQQQRGTKRGAPAETETGARRLVKKLRKSASRMSADLTPTTSNQSGKPRPSMTSAHSSFTSAASTEQVPDAFGRSSTGTAAASEATAPAGNGTKGGQRTPTKLKKRGIFAGRRQAAAQQLLQPTTEPHHQQAPQRPAEPVQQSTSLGSLSGAPVPKLAPQQQHQQTHPQIHQDNTAEPEPEPTPMELDSPEPRRRSRSESRSQSRSVSPEKRGGLAPPSFHYPYRVRTAHVVADRGDAVAPEPLSVVPDVNRGIPFVPRIPPRYKARQVELRAGKVVRVLHEGGENCDVGRAVAFGMAVGDLDAENRAGVSWYRA